MDTATHQVIPFPKSRARPPGLHCRPGALVVFVNVNAEFHKEPFRLADTPGRRAKYGSCYLWDFESVQTILFPSGGQLDLDFATDDAMRPVEESAPATIYQFPRQPSAPVKRSRRPRRSVSTPGV